MNDKQKIIFVVGPNKCGTISLHNFFKQNELNSVHWKHGTIALKILSNISSNLDPLDDLGQYDCFLDLYFITDGLYISPLALIDKIIQKYPDEIYILNTRNLDEWIKSRDKHGHGSLNERLNKTFLNRYDALKEFNGYKQIANYNLKNFHVFDLDKKNKFIDLSKFLISKGIKIKNTKEVHLHKTTW